MTNPTLSKLEGEKKTGGDLGIVSVLIYQVEGKVTCPRPHNAVVDSSLECSASPADSSSIPFLNLWSQLPSYKVSPGATFDSMVPARMMLFRDWIDCHLIPPPLPKLFPLLPRERDK